MKKGNKKHRQLGYGMYMPNALVVGGVGLTTTASYGIGNTGPNEVNASDEAHETAVQEAAEGHGASMEGASDTGTVASSGAVGGAIGGGTP